MNNWIPIFKTGTHTSSKGNTVSYDEAYLDGIVSKYDAAKHEAPVVIGHPVSNAPAWAWVEGLKREGQTLYMRMKDIVPEFAEMLKQRMFKKRSISLYSDGSIKHVGFLGATPPAVKGLEDIAFNEGDQTIIEFKEGGSMLEEIKTMFTDITARLNGLMPEQKKAGGAEMTEQEIQQKIQDGIAAELKAKDAEFAEAAKKKETEFSEREAALKKKEDGLKAEAAQKKKNAIADFCEGLKKDGRLVPAMDKLGMGITEFMNQISTIETTVEFSEGETKVNQTPLEFMQSFLGCLPKAIEFGEVAKRAAAPSGNAGEKLTVLTRQKIEAKKDLSYTQAFNEVQIENPELAAEYAEELKGQ